MFDFIGDIFDTGDDIVAPPPPEPTETELAIQEAILKMLQEEGGLSEQEQALQDLTYQLIEAQLQDILDARNAGDTLGDLSDQEREALDTMEQNAVNSLIESVGRGHEEISGKMIADLVDRGVLQGNVGAKALADLGEESQRLIAEGTTSIESEKMRAILALGESKAGRELQMEQFGIQAGQFSKGLAQQWKQTQMGGGLNMWGTMGGYRQGEADRALNAAIATAESQAAIKASMWNAFGGAAGAGIAASTREAKTNIIKLTPQEEEKHLDSIANVPLYFFNYKDGNYSTEDHMGVMTEDSPEVLVTKDGKHLNIINYLGYLTSCVKILAQKVQEYENGKVSST